MLPLHILPALPRAPVCIKKKGRAHQGRRHHEVVTCLLGRLLYGEPWQLGHLRLSTPAAFRLLLVVTQALSARL